MAFRGIVSNRPDNVSVEPTPSQSLSRSVSVIPGRRGDCHLDRDPLAVAGCLAPAPGPSGDRSPFDSPPAWWPSAGRERAEDVVVIGRGVVGRRVSLGEGVEARDPTIRQVEPAP